MRNTVAGMTTLLADPDADQDFSTAWNAWHEAHEAQRADTHGFLAVTGLYWLDQNPTPIDGIPGRWSTSEAGPVVELETTESLIVDGQQVTGHFAFGMLAERTGRTAFSNDIAIEVAKRGGHDIVRPRDPQNRLRTHYRGTPTFAPDASWVIEARYEPFETPRQVTVGAAVEGLQHVYEAPGVVTFDVDGSPLSLTVFNGHAPGTLLALLTDATSGVTTYAANRSVSIEAPAVDGRVTVDFNRATNLPCAYTDFATCPLPPAENRLAIAIEAGEKTPLERA